MVYGLRLSVLPAQPDALFGYVLHPAGLAANKASAAADRRVRRDVVDLVTIHETILPLGAVIAAAVGKFPGTTPEEMLAEITRHSRFTAEGFRVLATDQRVNVHDLHRRIRDMIEDAGAFIAKVPSYAVGVLFLENGTPVQPDITTLQRYQRNPGAPGGVWPTSPDIDRAMLNATAARKLNADRAAFYSAAPSTRHTFCPPNPNEFEIACRTTPARATFATQSTGSAGSGMS